MLLRKSKKPFKSLIRKEVIESYGEGFTGEQVLTHLFGDYDGWVNSDYKVYKYDKTKKTIINRINSLWVYPVYAVFIAPLKWVLTGHTGVESDTKLHSLLCWLLGELH